MFVNKSLHNKCLGIATINLSEYIEPKNDNYYILLTESLMTGISPKSCVTL